MNYCFTLLENSVSQLKLINDESPKCLRYQNLQIILNGVRDGHSNLRVSNN